MYTLVVKSWLASFFLTGLLASTLQAGQPVSLCCKFASECLNVEDCSDSEFTLDLNWNGSTGADHGPLEPPNWGKVSTDVQTLGVTVFNTAAGLTAFGTPDGPDKTGETWLFTYTDSFSWLTIHMPQNSTSLFYNGHCDKAVS